MSRGKKRLVPSFLPIHYTKLHLSRNDEDLTCIHNDFDSLPKVFYLDFLINFPLKNKLIDLLKEAGFNCFYLDRDNVLSPEQFKKNLDVLKTNVCSITGSWVVINSPLFLKYISDKCYLEAPELPKHPFFDCKPQRHFFLGGTRWKMTSDFYKVQFVKINKDVIEIPVRNERDLHEFVRKLKQII